MAKQEQPRVTHEGKETDSFVFYKSFSEAIKKLDRETRRDILEAIVDYGIYGEVDNFDDNPVAESLLIAFKPQMDANYRRRINGEKHTGKPKDTTEPREPRKRGRPKKAAAVPESPLDTDDADTPLFATTEEAAPAHTTELPDSGAEGELLIDDATKEEEPTLSDLRITPPKEKQQKKKFGENGYVRLTDEDYEDLVKNKGKELTDAAIDIYDCWLAAQSESKRKAELKKDHKFNLQVWPFQRAEEDLRKVAEKRAAESGKVVPIMPPVNKNNFLNFEQNSLSAEELQELEAKLIEN